MCRPQSSGWGAGGREVPAVAFCPPSVSFSLWGGSGGLQSRFAPNQASTKPSLTALFFVSAAQQLAQPAPGGGTALGAVQSPEPGGWWQPESGSDSGILLDSGSGSWAVGRCQATGKVALTGTRKQPLLSLADASGHSRCKTLLSAASSRAPGLPPASETAMATPRHGLEHVGPGRGQGVCVQCPIGSLRAVGRGTYYYITRITLTEELVPSHTTATLSLVLLCSSVSEGITMAMFVWVFI